ncbi:MAG TPA: ATP-dependent RecD-like DNA helicase [Sandaracinaceae bacterium LLY-WYZ-13_1]|nr:ATP-dependent RecD-like DNA helicase [Sandaracinaceae bacterium LLY-WYZ-13_1]
MTEALPLSRGAPRDDQVVQGTIAEVRFASDDGRFAVLKVQREAADEEITVIGDVGGLSPGEDARFRGRWEEHRKYGRRFRAVGWTPVLPSTRDGLTRFLGSGLVPGVGPALAKRLVGKFGDRTLDVITDQSVRLREIRGIGEKRAEAIADAVRSRRADAENLSYLHSLGIGPALSRKLLKKYGPRTVRVLREDPYLAAEEVRGVGFRTADSIGRAGGIGVDDPRRAAGAVLHLVGKAADDGHVFLPFAELARAASRLEVPAPLVAPAVETLAGREMLVVEDDRIYAPPLHRAEVRAAERLAALARPRAGRAAAARRLALPDHLSEQQREAVRTALTSGLMVLTGGPGTGKTTTVEAIVAAHEALELRVTLCAPTGRAAKRMSEASGREASTIHRLLEWNPALGAFNRDANAPLDTDLVLVDEASMLDLSLARALLDAVPPSASLVLVGDIDQLPPVGAGQVLREVIGSARAPVVRLDRVFRQAQRSAIVRGAHAILRGEVPTPTERGRKGPGDLFVVRAREPEAVLERVRSTLRRIPAAYGLDAQRDVQVLVPMRRGPLGTQNLNQVLQAELNPARSSATAAFRAGDKVMQLRNDYEREVFNGDIGWVQRVEDGVTYVTFDSGLRSYDVDDLDALTLAYASTIHKSQGSEFPAIVLVLHGAHYVLLSRALLYTAVTRAKRLVVLIGEERAIRRAARTVRTDRSHCRLGERLAALGAGSPEA